MPHLEIVLLGTVQVSRDGSMIADRAYAKVLALLAYLAVESDRSHQRASLAALLWPDQPEERARHSLRQALSTMRRLVGDDVANPPHILIARDTIAFNKESDHRVDVGVFDHLLKACEMHNHQQLDTCPPCIRRLEQAAALYRGDFLAGFSPGGSAAFDDWTQIHRQQMQRHAMAALIAIDNHLQRSGALDEAVVVVRRQLSIDPWEERAWRQLMDLLWKSGRRNDALAQFARCRQVLDEELGVEPEAETIALYEAIRSAAGGSRRSAPRERARRVARVPAPVNRLVGRQQELEEVADMLARRDCRLLTLIGPGGSGKTRLAIQLATDLVDAFAGGSVFVSLASVRDRDGIAQAIAAALGLQLASGDPEQQLIDWLRDRSLFLVLDNAEHLVDAMQVVPRMLGAAGDVRILITSREQLVLQGEWVYDVRGLAVPSSETSDGFEGYGAIELFGERLRQVRTRVPLRHEERPAIVRICQLVEGMPLAIELAAGWAQSLPLEQIATEIRRNLDFLSTSMRDLPDRHRSIRAVFNQTWQMLTAEERAAYLHLSVFRDGFQLAAAEAVANTSSHELSALVGKSLVMQRANGRYRLHGLLRHYGEEILRLDEAEHDALHARHCRYYLNLLASCEQELVGQGQREALDEIRDDIENIRVAWSWACQRREIDLLDNATQAMWLVYVMHGWMREGATAFGRAVVALDRANAEDGPVDPAGEVALARARVRFGGFQSGLGKYDHGISLLEEGIVVLRRHGATRELGLALNMLAAAIGMKGNCVDSRGAVVESLACFREVGDRWGIAMSLNDLGLIAHLLGDSEEAVRFCEESLAMFRRIGDRRGHALAAHNLGALAAKLGDFGRARQLHRDALALRQENEDQWGVASSYVQLGLVAREMESPEEARAFLGKALDIAWQSSVTPVVLDALVEHVALLLDGGDQQQAGDILTAVMAHPSLHRDLADRIEEMLARCEHPPALSSGAASDDRWAVRAVDGWARTLVG